MYTTGAYQVESQDGVAQLNREVIPDLSPLTGEEGSEKIKEGEDKESGQLKSKEQMLSIQPKYPNKIPKMQQRQEEAKREIGDAHQTKSKTKKKIV